MTRRSVLFGSYGNRSDYLVGRIARDRPDILQRMKDDEYRTVRQAAIDAGVVRVPHPDDAALERLLSAWGRADLETRLLFLALAEKEIDAAGEGVLLNACDRRPGPPPYSAPDSKAPDLERLIEGGMGVSELARALGVSHRTVCRWRAGTSKPGRAAASRIAALLDYRASPGTGDGTVGHPGEEGAPVNKPALLTGVPESAP